MHTKKVERKNKARSSHARALISCKLVSQLDLSDDSYLVKITKASFFSDFAWNEVRSLCFIAWLKVGFNSTTTICQTPILQLKDTMDHIQSSLIMLLPQIKVFIFRNAPLHFLRCQLSCIS